MTKPESAGKPFDISKRDVWEAYQKVKGNQGAPGVDGQTLDDFEKDLKGNLYKIWRSGIGCRRDRTFHLRCGRWRYRNRMAVEPERSGCPRSPTGSRRRLSPGIWRRRSSRSSTRIPMAIGRDARRWTRSGPAGSGAGSTTG